MIGGYAVAIHAQPRATGDLDIFIGTDLTNAKNVWNALVKFGAPLAGIMPQDLSEPDSFYTWGQPPFRVDIITTISNIKFEEAWINRTTQVINNEKGLKAFFISSEDLITNKLASGRHKDLGDVEALRDAAEQLKNFKS